MEIPLQITFRNISPSDAINANILERYEKIERFADQITSCRVIVEIPHKHKHKGYLYKVSIDITLPGEEIVSNRHSDKHHAHEDVYVAIRDAFDATKRQLISNSEKRRAKQYVSAEAFL